MPREFDKLRWLAEALERHAASRDLPEPKRLSASKKLVTDVKAIHGLNVFTDWCHSQAIELFFVSESNGSWSSSTRTIRVSSKGSPEYQLFIALHEAGHMFVEAMDEVEFNERYGNGYNSSTVNKDKFVHRIDCLAEEIEAWHRGWVLAKQLGLKIDRESYVKLRNRLLKDYVGWSLGISS